MYSLPFNERKCIVFVCFSSHRLEENWSSVFYHTDIQYMYIHILYSHPHTHTHILSLSPAEMDFAQTGSLVKDRHLLQRQMSATGEYIEQK